MSERERFEQWARTANLRVSRLKNRAGFAYLEPETHRAWLAWQAAKAEAAKEREKLVAEVGMWKRRAEHCRKSAESAWAEVERLRNENQCCRDEIAHLREVKIAAVNVTECSSSQLPAFLEELNEALTASDADGGWWRSIPEVESLVEAVWQVLDDMGEDGQCCCLAAKHDLRRAYEPFDDGEESPPPAPPADTEGA